MNKVQSIIVTVAVAATGLVALVLGQNDIALMCVGAEVGLLAPSPVRG
jgi:hypothetical protein